MTPFYEWLYLGMFLGYLVSILWDSQLVGVLILHIGCVTAIFNLIVVPAIVAWLCIKQYIALKTHLSFKHWAAFLILFSCSFFARFLFFVTSFIGTLKCLFKIMNVLKFDCFLPIPSCHSLLFQALKYF